MSGAIPVTLRWGASTDVGKVRKENQDGYCASPPVFAVADGMGGREQGAAAAAIAIDAMQSLVAKENIEADDLQRCAAVAWQGIVELSLESESTPGTTLTAAILAEDAGTPYWIILNIGDSRTYRFGSDGLVQITVDHSVVQEMVETGALTREEARTHPQSNLVTRAIVMEVQQPADIWKIPVLPNDRLVLCSDGLTAELPDTYIAKLLDRYDDPQVAAARLVQVAVDLGGRDNVTVVVVDATGSPTSTERTVPIPVRGQE
ncbi:protein phosphatase 2C domain-containing protein [Rhodococcus sp. IEGM 1379]|uniref:PP2C family protein-serine/threonine phosphatase n=1 Tax=Rhodococcus sp. IEGM 1379 TaxID=3047086 RepID=UPI0024B6B4AD|nr:protein phosphatase 2C domain-containing protein [Rhodococcus sp. IEGM 1379]MDI9914255.1 protein phosphatase 2C domain-containing protein [Rhodococcus sp. IEGM 1379]